MSDTLSVNGSAVDPIATNTTIDLLVPFSKGGIPELHFSRLLGALATLPDPWSGKAVSLQLGATGSTIIFAGDVVGHLDRWMDGVGWVREYRALGLVNRANYIPLTDSNTLTDTSTWNLPGTDPLAIPSREARTVGEIVAAILVMTENATPLNAAGLGAYTSMGPPTLPSATTADLAALTVIPPWRVSISGERILQSIEAFIQSCHPNHFLHVLPDGTIRVYDSRTFTANTLTMGGDPRLGMPMLTRDFSDCHSQVEIRGNTLVRAMAVQTEPWPGSSASDGGLAEDFGFGTTSNAAAKAAWVPSDWSQPNAGIGAALASGACTCPDTTHVTISTTLTLSANELAQGAGELLGQLQLFSDSLSGLVTQIFQARVTSNTATSGGSCTCQLDTAMPAVSYNSYKLYGLAAGENVVGRRYKVTNAAIAAQMLNYFPFPQAYVSASGTSAEMISSPMGIVMYNPFGGTSQPWNSTSVGVTLDPVNGLVYLDMPSQVAAYGLNTPVQWAANVEVILPVAVGTLTAFAPSNTTYAGTLYTVEGISRTKVITVLEWKDYSNQSNMNTFASEFLDSVKDVVVEGTVQYHGLLTPAGSDKYLAPGQALSIAGNGYTTGWESLALPVVSVEIALNNGPSGTSYDTTFHVSNRRGRYSSENFLRPNITGMQLGTEDAVEGGFGASNAAAREQSAQLAQGSRDMTKDGTRGEVGLDSDVRRHREQEQFRERYRDDDKFREQVDREQQRQAQEQQRQASLTPFQAASEGLGDMMGGAQQGLADLMGGAQQGLADMGIDLDPKTSREKNEDMNRAAGRAFDNLPGVG